MKNRSATVRGRFLPMWGPATAVMRRVLTQSTIRILLTLSFCWSCLAAMATELKKQKPLWTNRQEERQPHVFTRTSSLNYYHRNTIWTSGMCHQISGYSLGRDRLHGGKVLPRKHLLKVSVKRGCFILSFPAFHLLPLTNNDGFSHHSIMLSLNPGTPEKCWTHKKSRQTEKPILSLNSLHIPNDNSGTCETISEKWTHDLAQLFPSTLGLQWRYAKKCWCMKNNGGMLKAAVSACVVNCECVCVWVDCISYMLSKYCSSRKVIIVP